VLEGENVLHHDHITFHSLDLGDRGNAAGTIPHAVLVDDQVYGRGDLLADGA
jgi:hypothetical protein